VGFVSVCVFAVCPVSTPHPILPAPSLNTCLVWCSPPSPPQSALVHLGLGEWERLVADMEALDLLKAGTNK
jgi:hypothetical protein